MVATIWVSTARWIARTAGAVYAAFMTWFILAHALSRDGLPNLVQAPAAVQLGFLALFLMILGSILGWKWEGVAAAMILVGCLTWIVVERHLPWPPRLMPSVGFLYAFTWLT